VTTPETAATSTWLVSSDKVGKTPDKTNPNDDPSVPNYTFTYNGPRIDGSFGLGNFSFVTPYNVQTVSEFTSSTQRQDNDKVENNITSTVVPVAAAANTPEPATLALFGAALPVALLRLRRRS
jgi:hypothetical protein